MSRLSQYNIGKSYTEIQVKDLVRDNKYKASFPRKKKKGQSTIAVRKGNKLLASFIWDGAYYVRVI